MRTCSRVFVIFLEQRGVGSDKLGSRLEARGTITQRTTYKV